MNEESNILKPCPFCGSDDAWCHKGLNNLYTVECDGCAINIGWYLTEQEAINKWNTRTQQND